MHAGLASAATVGRFSVDEAVGEQIVDGVEAGAIRRVQPRDLTRRHPAAKGDEQMRRREAGKIDKDIDLLRLDHRSERQRIAASDVMPSIDGRLETDVGVIAQRTVAKADHGETAGIPVHKDARQCRRLRAVRVAGDEQTDNERARNNRGGAQYARRAPFAELAAPGPDARRRITRPAGRIGKRIDESGGMHRGIVRSLRCRIAVTGSRLDESAGRGQRPAEQARDFGIGRPLMPGGTQRIGSATRAALRKQA